MIPIRDTIPSKNYPVVNITLIGVNVVIFLLELAQGPGLDRFIYIYGLVPARYTLPQISIHFSVSQQILSFLSFMFLHGGFWHLLSNMWSLYIFGDNVEDRLGPFRYLVFYLLCGLLSGLSHLFLNLYSNMPTIGASGAIAGVMGAYFILYPAARILTLIPIFIIPYFIEIPAFFFLGFWFLLQFLSAAGSRADISGIAWWAHIGGFIFGIIFLKLFLVFPGIGASEKIRRVTAKKKTDRFQVVHPIGPGEDLQLYGTLRITHYEAMEGTSKMVNIPWGFKKRLFRINIPPGVKDGNVLRLRGLGKEANDGRRGDLLLKMIVGS
ncbi:MAG TPA: rhomboid family intramembrane serine protease [Desulfobacterales bacterium]|nr:rhomboid family intramembrane serine protease [Desulfobacterales bacterium]